MNRTEIEEKIGISLQHGPGWDFLIEKLIQLIESQKKNWIELLSPQQGGMFGAPQYDTFSFVFLQVKEKFSKLIIHYRIDGVEHDWSIFNKESYDRQYRHLIEYFEGFCDCLEQLSGSICEECGERGSPIEFNYWQRTLCSPCYSNLIHNEKYNK